MKALFVEITFLMVVVFAGIAANTKPAWAQEHNNFSVPEGYPDPYPFVLSVKRADPNPYPPPANTYTVDFTVKFSEPVTGVDKSAPFKDFALSTTGVIGAAVSQVSGSGDIYTVTVKTGRGDGTIRLDVIDNDSIRDSGNNPLGGIGAGNGNYVTGESYSIVKPFMTFTSVDVEDGWIRESSETGNTGGLLSTTATMLRVGDDAANRQYRAILSFDTSALPVDASHVTSVTLRLKFAGVAGTNPFSTHGNLRADIRMGAFRNNVALQLGDFNAFADLNNMLIFTNHKVDNWYSKSFGAANFQYISVDGVTQFRLRFAMDDNNDFGADYLKIYSGNALDTDRPQLVIEYYP